MDGNLQTSGGGVGPAGGIADTNWQIVGTGDFNGDGYTDLVWHHGTEGWVSVWLLAGENLLDARALSPNRVPDTNWRVQAVGDMNRDGRPDLIWRTAQPGLRYLRLMNGTSVIEGRLLTPTRSPTAAGRSSAPATTTATATATCSGGADHRTALGLA